MNNVITVLKHEMLPLLPSMIFFFVAFHIIMFAQSLMAEQYGISALSSMTALSVFLVFIVWLQRFSKR